uniref:ZAD domain-containing protein n=1 Tax=Stomoxys calcitrans TaxID=35570 RepID=A0A1I8Q3W6_STOCA
MICRLCLKDSASIASVVKLFHNSDLNIIEGLEVARLIKKYLEIEVTHDDVISTMICTECHGHLKEFHKFRRNVEERQCTLRSDFLQIQVKEETTNLIASNNGNDCDRIIPDTWGMEEDAPDYQMDIAKSELDEEKAENDQPIFLQTSDMNTNSAVDKGIFPNDNDLTGAMATMLKCIQKHIEGQTQALRREIHSQHQFVVNELFEIKMCLTELMDKNEEKKKIVKLFPIETLESMAELEHTLRTKDSNELLETVKKIIKRGGFLKNFRNLLGDNIIKDFNFDGSQGKKSFKSFENINDLFFAAAESECETFDAYKESVKRAFKLGKNKLYKAKCIEIKQRETNNAAKEDSNADCP